MNTILIGYKKVGPNGSPVGERSFFGEESEKERARIFDDAKRLHVFPKGIVHMEFVSYQVVSAAAFINATVTASMKSHADRQAKATAVAQDKRDKVISLEKSKKDAHAAVVETAQEFHKVNALANGLKTTLQNAPADQKAAVQKRLDDATAKADKAKEAFEKAKAHKKSLENPAPSKDETTAGNQFSK